MSDALLKPNERVLSTLNNDGSRRWLCPRPSPGSFLKWRRVVAFALIIVFTVLPHLRMNGKPMVLLDILRREFTFFGKTFLPTDTLLLALLLLIIFLTILLVTAMAGRVWCGWACPQTVYLEFIYRPIERLLEGTPGRRRPTRARGLRKVTKYVLYFLISAFLAHTFLSYFVGTDNLRQWILGSPTDHPIAFLVMAATTALMLFDFGFFREQVCCVVCPYARLQSAMLDKDSLIITYDKKRGEPRGKAKKPKGDVELPVLGDCVNCTLCVQTCPTGIDIRDGLQLECIGCAQCIDACDSVMTKLGRAKGLIRYSSERAVTTGKGKLMRARVILYPLVLVGLLTAFGLVLAGKRDAEFVVLRDRGMPFQTMGNGEIANPMRIRLTNRSQAAASYTVEVLEPEGVSLRIDENPFSADPGEQVSHRLLLVADPDVFVTSPLTATVRVFDGNEYDETKEVVIHGPRNRRPASSVSEEETSDG